MKTPRLNTSAPIPRISPLRKIPDGSRKDNPNPLLPVLMIILVLTGIIIFGQRGFEEVVEYDKDENPRLTPEREAEITEAKDKIDEAEVYLLLSLYDHYIDCFLCKKGHLWIKEGEIAKVGTTINGTSRYKQAYYRKHGVEYIMYFRGSIDLVLKKEIDLLGRYPLMPENLARKQPLLFPPLNSKLK